MASEETVGFAGLGAMGSGMATNLQKFFNDRASSASFSKSLHVYNRSRDKAEPLLQDGAVFAETPADLAKTCTVVFSMLLNGDIVRSVVEAFLDAGPSPGALFVECSTISPELGAELAAKAAAKGVHYLACPVFGRPDAIRAHRGVFVCTGDAASRRRAGPLLRAMGSDVLDLGDDVRIGYSSKLIGNFFITGFTELVGEGMTLADATGVGRDFVKGVLGRLFPGPFAAQYVDRIATDRYVPTPQDQGFNLTGGLKDVRLIRELARQAGVPLPLASHVEEHMAAACEVGTSDLDFTALVLPLRQQAGIPLPEPAKMGK